MIEKATGDVWWKNAVVYCVDVATFLDGYGEPVAAAKTVRKANR